MAEIKSITLKESKGLLTLTLNRPDRLNALLMESLEEIDAALERAASRKAVRAVIVTGAGRAFCSGLDLSCLKTFQKETAAGMRRALRKINTTFNAFEQIEKPVVAALNGVAVGAGLEIALACDVRIAAGGVRMGLVETRVGVMPDGGGCVRLARNVGIGRAKHDLGRPTDAEPGDPRKRNILAVTPAQDIAANHQLVTAHYRLSRDLVRIEVDKLDNPVGVSARGRSEEGSNDLTANGDRCRQRFADKSEHIGSIGKRSLIVDQPAPPGGVTYRGRKPNRTHAIGHGFGWVGNKLSARLTDIAG